MSLLNQFSMFTKNLAGLGQGKLIALAAAGIIAVGMVLGAGIYVNRPSFETLYVGLSEATSLKSALRLQKPISTSTSVPMVAASRFPSA